MDLCYIIGFMLLVIAHARQETCRENAHFDSCGTPCPLTCDNYHNPPEYCVPMCHIGCQCDEGYIQTKHGSCVRPENCSRNSDNIQKNCIDGPETGPCRAYFIMWHYDKESGTCREFIYGGCQGKETDTHPKKSACKTAAKVKTNKYQDVKTATAE